MFKQASIRHFASSTLVASSSTTATSSGPTTLYSFKKQLDEYIYFNNLSSSWTPYVYRKKNADYLTSLNAVDKKNHPITPREYPGIPSKKKLTKFISLLKSSEEINVLRLSLDELFKIRVSKLKNKKNNKYLEPSIVNQYLYKCFQLDYKLYAENLVWLDQIDEKDSVWSVKNTEAVAFIQSLIIKFNHPLNNEINFEKFESKLSHWINKANLDKEHSILYNASSIIASVYSNSLESNQTALTNLDNLTKEKVYSVKPETDYLQYDHAYSIISALKEASTVAQNEKLSSLVARWEPFIKSVESIKGETKSSYELFLENPAIIVKSNDTAEPMKSEEEA